MRNFFIISFVLLVSLFTACRSTRQVVQQVKNDSTSVSIIPTWEKYKVAADSVRMSFTPVISYRTGNGLIVYKQLSQKAESKRTKVEVKVDSTGIVYVTATCKELQDSILVLNKTIETFKTKVTEYQVKESKFTEFVNNVKRYLKFAFFSIAAITILWLIIKIGNPLKFIKSLFT
jgi:hypothetical protein